MSQIDAYMQYIAKKRRKTVRKDQIWCKTMRRCNTIQMAARVKNFRIAYFFCMHAYMHACMQACMPACTTLRCIMSNQMRRIHKKCHRWTHTCNILRKKLENGAMGYNLMQDNATMQYNTDGCTCEKL